MPTIDIEKLKAEMIAAGKQRRRATGLKPQPSAAVSADKRAIDELLKSFLAKAGLDIAKLDELLAKGQRDARQAFEEQKAEAAKHAASDREAYLHGIAGLKNTFAQLTSASANPTGQSSFIVLERALFILQEPNFETDYPVQLNVGDYDNWVKFNIDTDEGSDLTTFVFYFLWENLSEYYAVVNVATPITLNGVCEVVAAPGDFSGSTTMLQISTQLDPIEYWNQPPTLPAPQTATTFNSVLQLITDTGSIISNSYPSDNAALVNYQTSNLSYNMFLIPPASAALFEVSVTIDYSISDTADNIQDEVKADFLTGDHSVSCPFVLLQLVTPPPAA